jgi:hypothetical protein
MRLFEELLDERDGHVRELTAELGEMHAAFVVRKKHIRRQDQHELFRKLDEATQMVLMGRSEEQREAFMDLLLQEQFLKSKVSALKEHRAAVKGV